MDQSEHGLEDQSLTLYLGYFRCECAVRAGKPAARVSHLHIHDPISRQAKLESPMHSQGHATTVVVGVSYDSQYSQLSDLVVLGSLLIFWRTHFLSPLSVKPSRAWNTATLLTYCISPFSKLVDTLKRSPKKCKASSASAWASVIGGRWLLRGSCPKPT